MINELRAAASVLHDVGYLLQLKPAAEVQTQDAVRLLRRAAQASIQQPEPPLVPPTLLLLAAVAIEGRLVGNGGMLRGLAKELLDVVERAEERHGADLEIARPVLGLPGTHDREGGR